MNPRSKHSLKNLFIHLRSSIEMESAEARSRAIYHTKPKFCTFSTRVKELTLKMLNYAFLASSATTFGMIH
jgi:hypothetical protein